VASLGGFGEASSWASEPGACPALPGVGVVACPEGGRVNRGGPPVRRNLGRGRGSEPSYKARAEIGGWAEGVGARHSTADPQDSTTCGEGRLGTSVVLEAESRMRAWQTPTTP
jgi:hypothetical protein